MKVTKKLRLEVKWKPHKHNGNLLLTAIKITDYPQKATVFAKQAWEKMENK